MDRVKGKDMTRQEKTRHNNVVITLRNTTIEEYYPYLLCVRLYTFPLTKGSPMMHDALFGFRPTLQLGLECCS